MFCSLVLCLSLSLSISVFSMYTELPSLRNVYFVFTQHASAQRLLLQLLAKFVMKTNEKKKKKGKKKGARVFPFSKVHFQTFECLHEHEYYVLWFESSLIAQHDLRSFIPFALNKNEVTPLPFFS